jgi:hypothetical protein
MNTFLNESGLTTLWAQIKAKFVAKVAGKQLSTEDFTTAYKDKLDSLKNATPGTNAPLMDDVATVGSSEAFAREDHIHPSDTTKLDVTLRGAVNGVASLDATGKVPSEQLPSYVDDVVELLDMTDTAPASASDGDKYFNTTDLKIYTASGSTWGSPEDPLRGVIYINLAESTGLSYRWSGSVMTEITSNDLTPMTEAEILAITSA